MLKLTPVGSITNKFTFNYSVCHTGNNDRDFWVGSDSFILHDIENENDLKEYLECFDIVKNEVDQARSGLGIPAENIDFDKYVDSGQYEKVEWTHAEGVSFIKNGKEYFINIEDDIGMPTEDGHFLQGIRLDYIGYFDENGIEHYVTIE